MKEFTTIMRAYIYPNHKLFSRRKCKRKNYVTEIRFQPTAVSS